MIFDQADVEQILSISICAVSDLPRPRKRLTELMMKTALEIPGEKEQERQSKASRVWAFRFLRSPIEILANPDNSRTAGIRLAVNRLEVNRICILKLKKSCSNVQLPRNIGLVKNGYFCVSRVQVRESEQCPLEKWRM